MPKREVSRQFIRDINHMVDLIQENFTDSLQKEVSLQIGSRYFLAMN